MNGTGILIIKREGMKSKLLIMLVISLLYVSFFIVIEAVVYYLSKVHNSINASPGVWLSGRNSVGTDYALVKKSLKSVAFLECNGSRKNHI